MTEDLLHFIWKFRLLKPVPLCSTSDFPLEIVYPGVHNHHAGPDFSNGKIRLNGVLWAGNIEIHRRSSEWDQHGHQHDCAYNNVVLHVVYEHDRDVFTAEGRAVPTLELRNVLEEELFEKYDALYKNREEIACGASFSECDSFLRESWLERVLIERMEQKAAVVAELFHSCDGNWEQAFYLLLCRNLGFKVNADTFVHLGRITPLNLLLRHAHNILQIEALLFGQAGLLQSQQADDYYRQLQREFNFLQIKYGLRPMQAQAWKFSRMRPANFPTIRIAQLAAFIAANKQSFSQVIESESPDAVRSLFEVVPHSWWDTHYTFSVSSPARIKKPGDESVNNIFINTISPLLFYYGKERQREDLCAKALDWLARQPAEDNQVTRLYDKVGYWAEHGGQSQALIQLHTSYCSQRKCLRCAIGTSILKQPLPVTSV